MREAEGVWSVSRLFGKHRRGFGLRLIKQFAPLPSCLSEALLTQDSGFYILTSSPFPSVYIPSTKSFSSLEEGHTIKTIITYVQKIV